MRELEQRSRRLAPGHSGSLGKVAEAPGRGALSSHVSSGGTDGAYLGRTGSEILPWPSPFRHAVDAGGSSVIQRLKPGGTIRVPEHLRENLALFHSDRIATASSSLRKLVIIASWPVRYDGNNSWDGGLERELPEFGSGYGRTRRATRLTLS